MREENLKIKGHLGVFLKWPLLMVFFLLVIDIWVYFIDHRAGILLSGCVVFYLVVAFLLYIFNRNRLLSDLVEFSGQYEAMQNSMLEDLPAPAVIITVDGRIIWKNNAFLDMTDKKKEIYLYKVFPQLNKALFPKADLDMLSVEVDYGDRHYLVQFRRMSAEKDHENDYENDRENDRDLIGQDDSVMIGKTAGGKELHTPVNPFSRMMFKQSNDSLIAVYFRDTTELNEYIKENEAQRMVAGLIYIDNYDEILDSIEEVRQSLFVALIDRKINNYINNVDGLVKKLEQDKYFIVLKRAGYEKLAEDRFSLLEDVKQVNVGNTQSPTLSIGIGIHESKYSQSYSYARTAINLGLARGGDQAVIKNGEEIAYFGGKKEMTMKNTRVKARVKAESLREFMEVNDQIFVMGHKIADPDSFGACIGIYRAAVSLNKKAHIIVNELTNSVRPLYDEIAENASYGKNLFLSSEAAMRQITDQTMVVVVDTNKPQMTECPELLKRARMIAVLDHHRQNSQVIENANLSYIEPYASSTSEMVAEMLQYMVDDIRVPSLEADCLYSGIMIDTRNFMNRTGVRTFEAAAFLRRCGADITRVRKMFRDDMESYRAKAEAVQKAEVYRMEYAIAVCPGNVESPTVLAAQTANELLDISRIKASFVLTEYEGRIYMSARSIDEVNVQIIAEKLGGGGHINASGAQFEHTDMDEAISTLKETIDVMIKNGDI